MLLGPLVGHRHEGGGGEVGNVAHDGHQGVVAVGGQGDHLGPEVRHDPGHGREGRVLRLGRGREDPDGALEQGPIGAVEAVELRAGHRMPATEPGVGHRGRDRPLHAAHVGHQPGRLGQCLLGGVGDGGDRGGDEGDRRRPGRAGSTTMAPRRCASSIRAGSSSSPCTVQPRDRRPRATEPPMRPRPTTLARRRSWLAGSGPLISPGPDRDAGRWRPPGRRGAARTGGVRSRRARAPGRSGAGSRRWPAPGRRSGGCRPGRTPRAAVTGWNVVMSAVPVIRMLMIWSLSRPLRS